MASGILPSTVGRDEILLLIRGHPRDDAVGVIGVYGPGGIGKTTLLRKIYDEFRQAGAPDMFDIVMWVTVSQDMSIERMQELMAPPHVGVSFRGGESSSMSKSVFEVLSNRQYLLFLDDVWQKFDLDKVGIPHPGDLKNRMIAFTTRSFQVCSDMDADQQLRSMGALLYKYLPCSFE